MKKKKRKPLNRGCLYLLFCRTCKTTVYLTRHGEAESNCATVTNCLGLFNATDVAYSGYRVRKVWLKSRSVLNDKDAIFHMHKAVACLFSDSVRAVDSRMHYTSGIIVKFSITI